MKKVYFILFVLFVLTLFFSGCISDTSTNNSCDDGDEVCIVDDIKSNNDVQNISSDMAPPSFPE